MERLASKEAAVSEDQQYEYAYREGGRMWEANEEWEMRTDGAWRQCVVHLSIPGVQYRRKIPLTTYDTTGHVVKIGSHYAFEYKGIKLDPYRIFKVYRITDPCQQHAIKKLLRAGKKEGNPLEREIDEVISTLQRWKEMLKEDSE